MPTPPLLQPHELGATSALDLGPDGLPVHPLVLVDLDGRPGDGAALRAVAGTSRVLVGLSAREPEGPAARLAQELTVTLCATSAADQTCVQVEQPEAEAALLAERVQAAPRAATVLVDLLRLTARLPVREGLVAESLAYSLLLGGPEFAAWRSSRPRREQASEDGPLVLLDRVGDVVEVALARPTRHNAFSRRLRDELVAALEAVEEMARAEPSLTVRLTGRGPSFCSGGDLDEFGTARDLAAAHLVRTGRSAAAVLHRLRDRTTVELHGACIGAGLELPSFAGRVVARPGARLVLPELGMGLVPGAGGTVGVTARAGRWRTAHLVLTGRPLDPGTALTWGVVDAVEPAD